MHSISVYLIRKEEIRGEKIDFVLEGSSSHIKWVELDSNILATTRIPNIRDFGQDKTIAKIETDYFSGSGYQSAKLFVNSKKVYDKSDEQDWSIKPINDVLKQMGIVSKQGMDEFDTVGLGRYRKNEDFVR
jgi:hypothetical protein